MHDKLAERNWGNLVIALDPQLLLGGLGSFTQAADQLLARVKGARRLPGVAEVLLPGERSGKLAGRWRHLRDPVQIQDFL